MPISLLRSAASMVKIRKISRMPAAIEKRAVPMNIVVKRLPIRLAVSIALFLVSSTLKHRVYQPAQLVRYFFAVLHAAQVIAFEGDVDRVTWPGALNIVCNCERVTKATGNWVLGELGLLSRGV